MQNTKNVAVLGHFSLDKIKIHDEEYNNLKGGAVLYNSLSVLTNNVKAHIISTYCSDFNLEELINNLSQENLLFDQVLPILGNQRRSFMEYNDDFVRTSHSHARKKWLDDTILQSPRHLPSMSINYDGLMIAAMIPNIQGLYMDWFKNNTNAIICLDTSEYFAEHYREEIIDNISKANIFIPSDVELDLLYPENNKDINKHIDVLSKYSLDVLIIKRSVKGSVLVDYRDGTIHKLDIRETDAIDATGAGDSFAGSFLSHYINTNNLLDSAKVATVTSSHCVEKIGYEGLLNLDKEKIRLESKSINTKKIRVEETIN